MKKIAALLMAVCLIFTMIPAAGAETKSVDYLYTFIPGTALEGEGSTFIIDLMNALQIRLTRQHGDEEDLYRVILISEGKDAFTLMAQDTKDGEYSLACSLLGKHLLKLRKDQLTDFLRTLVQILADLNILKGESLEKVDDIAVRLGNLLNKLEGSRDEEREIAVGIDLAPYMEFLDKYATDREETPMDPDNEEYPGAVVRRHYQLSEEDLNDFVGMGLAKVNSISVLRERLQDGSLRIGKQVITDSFIRTLFQAMHGESTLDAYLDADGQLVGLVLNTPELDEIMDEPELEGLITDEDFLRIRGLKFTIHRENGEGLHRVSTMRVDVLGLDEMLVAIKMERTPGEKLTPPKGKEIHEVGELNSAELWDLLKSMWMTILAKAADLVLDLPRCVFDRVVDKLF